MIHDKNTDWQFEALTSVIDTTNFQNSSSVSLVIKRMGARKTTNNLVSSEFTIQLKINSFIASDNLSFI